MTRNKVTQDHGRELHRAANEELSLKTTLERAEGRTGSEPSSDSEQLVQEEIARLSEESEHYYRDLEESERARSNANSPRKGS